MHLFHTQAACIFRGAMGGGGASCHWGAVHVVAEALTPQNHLCSHYSVGGFRIQHRTLRIL